MKTCDVILPRSGETEGIDHIELINETCAANFSIGACGFCDT